MTLSTVDLLARPLAQLPTAGVRNGAQAWVTDGLKQGESSGAGTGVPAYFDEASSSWLLFSDDSAVST